MRKTGRESIDPTQFLITEEPVKPEWEEERRRRQEDEDRNYEIFKRISAEQEKILRQKNQQTIIRLFIGLTIFTAAMIVVVGFHLFGFSAECSTLQILIAPTIGEVAGILYLLYGARKNGSTPKGDDTSPTVSK